jgi:transposase
MKAMTRHRSHSIEFKRHDVSRNLIRVRVAKYGAGAFDDDAQAADLIQVYEAKIAALVTVHLL